METWERENIIKRLNDDFFITIEDPLESFHADEHPSDYSDQYYPDYSDQDYSIDPDQNDPDRSQSYIHQTKSSNEERSCAKVRFSVGKKRMNNLIIYYLCV